MVIPAAPSFEPAIMDRSREIEHLGRADMHIAEGERRVTEQMMRNEKLRADGHSTARAEAFLRTLEVTLVEWRGHRETILGLIARIDVGLAESGAPADAESAGPRTRTGT